MRGVVAAGVIALACGGTSHAVAPHVAATRAASCQHAARSYETRCLMPRVEARLRFADDADATGFVGRMQDIDQRCADVTAVGLATCVAWPRVRPTAEYRRWLRDLREVWERREEAIDGARPACPPGVPHCL